MVAIVDYGAGNLTSVANAVAYLGHDGRITADPAVVAGAERVIFPGQGAAGSAMANLRAGGLDRAVRQAAASGRPLLGICIGHQLIFEHSEENGGTSCLGLLPGRVVRFDFPGQPRLKIPQMGWNRVLVDQAHPVLGDLDQEREYYFVHSYYPQPAGLELSLGRTEYGDQWFASVVGRANLVSVQFHPEKSGRAGLELLERFLTWEGQPC